MALARAGWSTNPTGCDEHEEGRVLSAEGYGEGGGCEGMDRLRDCASGNRARRAALRTGCVESESTESTPSKAVAPPPAHSEERKNAGLAKAIGKRIGIEPVRSLWIVRAKRSSSEKEGPGWASHAEDEQFCSEHECIGNFDNGHGTVVECSDGEWSHSGGRSVQARALTMEARRNKLTTKRPGYL